ncbi:HPr family phosphocarrier protein [Kallotenue papyrolyticum]|uniref:HPr family phosphocarrier protein n=1 Tax=Kallotenue papyrolyticum TaxID=1325125 RepID=UPI00047867CB|nr:HPr family phosphocarrier protein [Kallotenue papyrolyticum]
MSETRETVLTIAHPVGLHLRPAALFVKTAARFQSDIRIANLDRPDRPEVDAKSMFGLMQIGVSQNHRIRVRATGEDAAAALSALQRLVEQNFEE